MFWFGSGKTISISELDRLLKEIPILQPKEREYVKGVFTRYKSGGIGKLEVEKAVRELKRTTADIISREEAEAISQKLLSRL